MLSFSLTFFYPLQNYSFFTLTHTLNSGVHYTLSQEEKELFPSLYELSSSFREKFSVLYQKYYSHNWTNYLDVDLTLLFKNIFLECNELQLKLILKGEKTPIISFFKDVILSNQSGIICLSCYELTQFNQLLLREIRGVTKSKIVLGGAFTSHLSDLEIQALIEMNCVDYLVIGPGDRSLPELIKCLENGTKQLPTNVVDTTKPYSDCILIKKPLSNLSDLPYPDFSQSQIERYPCPIKILPLQTARGCTYRKCTFCSHHNSYYGEYHVIPIEKMVEMITYLSNKYHCDYFLFHDEEIPFERLRKISFKTTQKLPNIRFSAYVRADSSFTEKNNLKELHESGVRCLNWGIESGSQTILDYIKKGINISAASSILKESYEVGISNTCWLMINIPNETDEDFNLTINFILDNTKYVNLWMVSPFRLQYDSPMFIDFGNGSEKTPFCTSVKPTQKMLDREQKMISKIDSLSSLGLLSNNKLPNDILPQGCQRARLLPFVFLSSILSWEELNTIGVFQIVLLNSKIITVGTKHCIVKGRKRLSLPQIDIDWINRGVYHILNIKELNKEQFCLLKELIESGYIYTIKASTLWDTP